MNIAIDLSMYIVQEVVTEFHETMYELEKNVSFNSFT